LKNFNRRALAMPSTGITDNVFQTSASLFGPPAPPQALADWPSEDLGTYHAIDKEPAYVQEVALDVNLASAFSADDVTPLFEVENVGGNTFNELILASHLVGPVVAGEAFEWMHQHDLSEETVYSILSFMAGADLVDNPRNCYISSGDDGYYTTSSAPVSACRYCGQENCTPFVCVSLRRDVG